VDGARVAFDGLGPALRLKDPTLDKLIDARFVALQKLLDQQRTAGGFTLYDQLSRGQVKGLSNAVNALSELLSELTAAVV
ncbi:MAG: iron uptake system component EfeO, partial [Actinomycetota bacterium]|nr:iron uptake system component EfeO [Actinomycetota bacterium]